MPAKIFQDICQHCICQKCSKLYCYFPRAAPDIWEPKPPKGFVSPKGEKKSITEPRFFFDFPGKFRLALHLTEKKFLHFRESLRFCILCLMLYFVCHILYFILLFCFVLDILYLIPLRRVFYFLFGFHPSS